MTKNKSKPISRSKKQVSNVPKGTLHPQESDELCPDANFPIVGIGASAGGLKAFEAFFSGMPTLADTGMAFVLVQHLDPNHKSILTDLIRRYTRMQVFEVEDGVTVRPNCAYIIPPNRDMAFLNGTLQLMEPSAPRGQRLPIDFFFRSLAQDLQERAICIVLSGTGSDGALGVRAVKGAGGMVMVQSPESTEYDGMPRSAIATGLVDYELPPAEMSAQIMAYVAHAFGKSPLPATIMAPKTENALKKIFILLRAHTSHDFSQYKPSTIHRRIERRMAVGQIKTIDEYVKYLQQTPSEVDALFRDLLIGVTNFFRDPATFKAIEEQVIPKIFGDKPAGGLVRVWSPGCSTGEEAYSLAILLVEHQEALNQSIKVQVFATDIDNQAIATARQGLYPASITADIEPTRLARFFTAETNGSAYRIHKSIRDIMIFSEQDVVKDPPFSKLDLISCRNLLIYMDGSLQKKLIPLLHYALNPGGFLFLGTSETIGEFGNLFITLDRKSKIYQRREDFQRAQRLSMERYIAPLMDAALRPATAKDVVPRILSLRELTEQALLQQVAPAAALVNNHGDILYLHGRTGMYLELPPGESRTSNILKMAREGLRHELTLALHKAEATKEIVNAPGLRVKTNGNFITVNLTIRPVAALSNSPSELPLYLVILAEAPLSDTMISDNLPSSKDPSSEMNTRIAALRKELRAKEEYLQAANEELETSNEELKSSNEEMQSVNEELQSTNEELETSKEEMQSINEELATVNAELHTKVADLSRLNNDMNNLLAGTGIGTIFVDHQLRILRFTPAITSIINLISSDIGRSVGHIVSNLMGYDSIVADTQAVLASLIPKDLELQTKSGTWYTMRILPYRTLDNVIEGAVITFVNITESKNTESQREAALALLRQSEEKYRSILENMQEGYFEVDLAGNFTFFNDSLCRIDGYSRDELMGMNYRQYTDKETAKKVFQAFNRVYKTGEPLPEINLQIIRKDGTNRYTEASVSLLKDSSEKPVGFRGIIRDITERKIAEEALQREQLFSKLVLDNLPGIFYLYTYPEKRLVQWNKQHETLLGFKAEEMKNRLVTEWFALENKDAVLKAIEEVMEKGQSSIEAHLVTKDGHQIPFILPGVRFEVDNQSYFMGIGTDITERKKVEDALRESEQRYLELSIIDDLTHLYNSRHFYAQLKKEIERANRYEQPLTLLLLDLDKFKAFNDTYGHVEGDNVLSRLGQVVKRCLREPDSAYRYGGEEFTIILPMTSNEEGLVTAERIQTEFRKENFSPVPGKEFYMTMSIGLSQYQPKEDLKTFVQRVDKLMYKGKKSGRDKICSDGSASAKRPTKS